jgi:hypothetical protein
MIGIEEVPHRLEPGVGENAGRGLGSRAYTKAQQAGDQSHGAKGTTSLPFSCRLRASLF